MFITREVDSLSSPYLSNPFGGKSDKRKQIWLDILDKLPKPNNPKVDFLEQVRVNFEYEESEQLRSLLMELKPWRKGPFQKVPSVVSTGSWIGRSAQSGARADMRTARSRMNVPTNSASTSVCIGATSSPIAPPCSVSARSSTIALALARSGTPGEMRMLGCGSTVRKERQRAERAWRGKRRLVHLRALAAHRDSVQTTATSRCERGDHNLTGESARSR